MTGLGLVGAGVVAVGTLVWWLRRAFIVVTVAGTSMAPTFAPGDRVLVRRTDLVRVRVGDVVVAAPGRPVPGGPRPLTVDGVPSGRPSVRPPWLVKRVVAGPGDPVPEPARAVLAAAADDRVPPGRFVAFGDNAQASADSRQIGYFHAAYLLGVVVAVVARGR